MLNTTGLRRRQCDIRPIRNEEDYATAMARIDELWGVKSGTAEGDELEVLALVVGKYEDEYYPMPPSNPIEAIKFRMDQQGLTPRDLESSSDQADVFRKCSTAVAGLACG